jgi:hypothetical protein
MPDPRAPPPPAGRRPAVAAVALFCVGLVLGAAWGTERRAVAHVDPAVSGEAAAHLRTDGARLAALAEQLADAQEEAGALRREAAALRKEKAAAAAAAAAAAEAKAAAAAEAAAARASPRPPSSPLPPASPSQSPGGTPAASVTPRPPPTPGSPFAAAAGCADVVTPRGRSARERSDACPGATLRSQWDAAPPAPVMPACTANQSRAQADWLVAQVRERTSYPSACASGHWLARARDADAAALLAAGGGGGDGTPASSPVLHRRVVNVGANKGYLAAGVLGLWAPATTGASPRGLGAWLTRRPEFATDERQKHLCGVCKDCEEVLPPASAPLDGEDVPGWLAGRLGASVWAVEPQPSNLGLLAGYADSLPSPALLPVHAGAANWTGVGAFEERGAGDEGSSLGNPNRGSGALVAVEVTTVDALVAARVDPAGAYVLDLLLVDAEEYDPIVLAGAEGTLPFTRAVAFEYAVGAMWDVFTLEDVVGRLDTAHGFDCYFQWGDGLVRLTGCWDARMELRAWTNVLCLNRRDTAWAPTLRALATHWQGR